MTIKTDKPEKSDADRENTLAKLRSLKAMGATAPPPTPTADGSPVEAAHRAFVNIIEVRIEELLQSCRTLEAERSDIEAMRAELQIAVDSAEARLAQAEASNSMERIEELENRLLELNQENIRLSELLLSARQQFDTLVDFIEEQELLESQKAANQEAEETFKRSSEHEQELLIEAEQLKVQLEFVSNELERLRNEPIPEDPQVEILRRELETAQAELDELRSSPAAEDPQVELLTQRIEELQGELESLHELRAAQDSQLETYRQQVEDLQFEVENLRDQGSLREPEQVTLRSEIESLQREVERLREENSLAAPEQIALRAENEELQSEIERIREESSLPNPERIALRSEIEELQSELERIRHSASENSRSEGTADKNDGENAYVIELQNQIEELHRDLTRTRSESIDLRMQADELSARIAQMKGPTAPERSQAMSWEERKAALLEQLDAESADASDARTDELLEMAKLIEDTTLEILKRDLEIQELRNLLAQQSISQEGFAIGAAAVAQVIDNDALVVAERMKLKELQAEWEQKQRQAEIEMSLERAKLGRERLELQERLRDMESMQGEPGDPAAVVATARQAGRKGRWLSRLGLKEE